MKKGFTLVELSIVLVIIGLLIGGILVGQSLIDSAKLNSEVRKLSQYSIALVNFRQKFKQEAGDSSYFSAPGNNDGDTEDAIGSCPARISEGVSTWSHLSESKMISESFSYPSPGSGCTGDAPQTKGPTYAIELEGGTVFNIGYNYRPEGYSTLGTNYLRSFFIVYDIETLLALENKLDDGTPSKTTGSIYSDTGYNSDVCTMENAISEGSSYGFSDPMFCNVRIYFSPSSEMPLLPN